MSSRNGVRLLPVVIVALAALGILKVTGLILHDGSSLSPISVATAQDADAGAPDETADGGEGDGSSEELAAVPPAAPAMNAGEMSVASAGPKLLSESERAVLESLRLRRKELEMREQALSMRENLILAAEQRVDTKVSELKAMEARIQASIKDKEDADDQQFAGLVKMYESMKSKAAARIFNRMDVGVVVGVARRMNPEVLAKVLAAMDPASAERVTIEIAQISGEGTGFVNELDAIVPQ